MVPAQPAGRERVRSPACNEQVARRHLWPKGSLDMTLALHTSHQGCCAKNVRALQVNLPLHATAFRSWRSAAKKLHGFDFSTCWVPDLLAARQRITSGRRQCRDFDARLSGYDNQGADRRAYPTMRLVLRQFRRIWNARTSAMFAK